MAMEMLSRIGSRSITGATARGVKPRSCDHL